MFNPQKWQFKKEHMAILCEISNAAAKNGFFNQQRWEMTEATIRERWCGDGPVEIVSFPMKSMNSMVIFHSYVNVYQRVYESPTR